MLNTHVFLNLETLPTNQLFFLKHLDLQLVCKVKNLSVDYVKQQSSQNASIETETNYSIPNLPGANKFFQIEFLSESSFSSNSILPILDTSSILNLIEQNEKEKTLSGKIKSLILSTSSSKYYVQPSSIEIIDTFGTAHLLSLAKIPPILSRPLVGGILKINFIDKALFQKGNPINYI